MKVHIKSFDVEMQIKSKGIELEVRTPDGSDQLGDCYATMTGLIWCKGKTHKRNGVKLSWQELSVICSSTDAIKAAVSAAKKVQVGDE